MRKVFISYSRHNLEIVSSLIHDLQAVGIDTWHDQTLTGGQRWWDNILSNIRECEVFIFSLSVESWDSEACRSELNYAVQLGKTILPVLIAEGININLLPPPLSEIQVMNYRNGDKDSVFALVRSVYSAPPSAALPDPLPASPKVPISYLSNLKERIESPEPLSSQNQITLLFELEEELREGRSPAEVRDLLLRLKRRDELLAKIAAKIDAALKNLDEKSKPPTVATKEEIQEESAAVLPSNIFEQFGAGAENKFCGKCGARMEAGQRFCGSCGAAQTEQGSVAVMPSPGISAREERSPQVDGAKTRHYVCQPEATLRLVTDVKFWLDQQGFHAQQLPAENQSLLLQVKKKGGWRDYVGMATSLNLLFQQSGNKLTVQIGAGKWLDKAAAGTVSLFLLWPLAITAGLGAWEQMKMPEKIFDYIESRLL